MAHRVGPSDGEGYAADLVAQRAHKDHVFREAAWSPIPEAARAAFGGLSYFPPDEGLRFAGLRLEEPAAGAATAVEIETSDGRRRPARRAGTFTLLVGDAPCTLAAYTFEGDRPGAVFVPFQDATSGTETYAAGRYLDLAPGPDGTYVLDFNLAYEPYCAFDAGYSCPLAPAENRLPVRIEAGERRPDAA